MGIVRKAELVDVRWYICRRQALVIYTAKIQQMASFIPHAIPGYLQRW